MAKQKFLVTLLSALSLGCGLLSTSAQAATLSLENALLLTQGTFPDVDAASLARLFGPADPTFQLIFQQTTFTSTSSTSFVRGKFPTELLPNPSNSNVDLNYVLDLSKYSSLGIISWTSSGTYASLPASGSGSIAFEDTGGLTFEATLTSSLTVDGKLDNQNYDFLGTTNALTNPSFIQYTSTDNEISVDFNPDSSSTKIPTKKGTGKSRLVTTTPTIVKPSGQVIPGRTVVVTNSCRPKTCNIGIPEPSSVLGLLSVSVFCAGLIIQQKLKKKA